MGAYEKVTKFVGSDNGKSGRVLYFKIIRAVRYNILNRDNWSLFNTKNSKYHSVCYENVTVLQEIYWFIFIWR